jgi:hypothetical protein
MDFVPEESAIQTDSIEVSSHLSTGVRVSRAYHAGDLQVDRDTMDMLKAANLGSLPGLTLQQVRHTVTTRPLPPVH